MHLRFNFDACPVHSPFGFVHLTHQNLSAHTLFCLNSLAKVKYAVTKNKQVNLIDCLDHPRSGFCMFVTMTLCPVLPGFAVTPHKLSLRCVLENIRQDLGVDNVSDKLIYQVNSLSVLASLTWMSAVLYSIWYTTMSGN